MDYISKIPKGSWGIVNGEPVQGTNPKDARLSVTIAADQVNAAVQVLQPFVERCSEVWTTYGTEWHEDIGGKLAAEVWKELQVLYPGKVHKPSYDLWLNWNGERIHICHHRTGSSAASSKASGLNKSMVDMLVEAPARNGVYPTIVVRSHTHDPIVLDSTFGLAIGLPSWQLKTGLAQQKFPASTPVIGGFILELDHRAERHVWQSLYRQETKPSFLRPRPVKK